MKKVLKIASFLVLSGILVFANAYAYPFNDRDPQIALSGPYGDEDALQTILNNVLDPDTINAASDQHTAALWNSVDLGSNAFTISTFTTNGGTLGIYNLAGTMIDLGTYSMGPNPVTNADTLPGFPAVGFLADSTGLTINNSIDADNGDWTTFGFYWFTIDGERHFTEDSKNDGGAADALAYLVEDGTVVDYSYYWENKKDADTATGSNDWIIAFDNGSNGDFNDGVFYFKDMQPIPEPATMLLFGLGVLGLGAVSRKKLMR